MSEDKVTPEALVDATTAPVTPEQFLRLIEAEEEMTLDRIADALRNIDEIRANVKRMRERLAVLRRMLPRAPRGPRKAKATD